MRKNNLSFLIAVFVFLNVFTGDVLGESSLENLSGKKILFINSYHEGFEWSDNVIRGLKDALKNSNVELDIFYMNTKRNPDEAFIKKAALKAKTAIEEFQPDVVIACDDNASKYLIKPYYKNADLPFVFCGVNWDASVYGFPYENVTGMVEVEMIASLVTQLQKYSKSNRIGWLSINRSSSRKIVEYNREKAGIVYDKIYFVETFDEWKRSFKQLQDEVDILILGNLDGLPDWNEIEAKRFVAENTRIPTGATAEWRMPYSLMGYLKVPEEQGIWAAETAFKILKGKRPSEIPITQNQQAKLAINLKYASVLGITFEPSIFNRTEILQPYQGKKIAYIGSYHKEMLWSVAVFNGFKEVVAGTGIDLKVMYMDTKRNKSEEFKKAAALKAKKLIEEFSPDVVITVDDNAAKYLIVPYYKNSVMPFVFCGINEDISAYGLPYKNVTGMMEVEMISPLISQLRQYSKGNKIGRLAMDSLSQRKTIEYQTKRLGLIYENVYFVNTMEEWKNSFIQAQNEVDMLIIDNPQGMTDWDEAEFKAFATENTKIPTGTNARWRMPYSFIGYTKVPEEQGRWSAKAALKILDGVQPADIPIVINKEGTLMINIRLVKQLGIVLDRAIYQHAEIFE